MSQKVEIVFNIEEQETDEAIFMDTGYTLMVDGELIWCERPDPLNLERDEVDHLQDIFDHLGISATVSHTFESV